MIVVVTGGSGSGKSEYAEGIVTRFAEGEGLKLYYIATMRPFGDEGRRRVERHRKLRAGKGFETVERYTDLKGLELEDRTAVLLECMSNLAANEMFEPGGAGERTVEEILDGVDALARQCRHLVIVTNDIFSDGITYDEMTSLYQERLGRINQEIVKMADQAFEVVCGIPIVLKAWKCGGVDSGRAGIRL